MSCDELATLAEDNRKSDVAEVIRTNQIDGAVAEDVDDEVLEELCPTKLERLKMKEALKCSSHGSWNTLRDWRRRRGSGSRARSAGGPRLSCRGQPVSGVQSGIWHRGAAGSGQQLFYSL